jgi:superfamily II DNA or RNA helicase
MRDELLQEIKAAATANLAAEKPVCHLGGETKQAELVPEVQLQPHQERVREKFEGDNPRMLLYHGLGSGKSLSAIAAAEAARANTGEDYGIVVPASLKGNFQKELEKFTQGSSPEVMSYTGLGLGKKFKTPPGTIIMDEAHRIRNPAGAAAHAARDAAYNANRLLLLTGSPITNSPADLANLVSLLKRQPISPQDFEKKFIGSKKVYPGIFNYLRGITPGHQAVIKNEGELRNMLRGHVDYQPSKTPEGVNVNEETVTAPLTSAQKKIQKALRTKIPPGFLWKLDTEFPLGKEELSKLNSFLTGLRQNSISTAPFRRDGDPLKAFEQSGKLQLAMKKLREVVDSDARKKAIIYSNHIGAGLEPYAAALAANNIPYGMFHGGIPTKQRQQSLKDYNEGKLRALLIGPAGAEGLSTKGTNLIQILDPHWHESRTQQARGRGLRFDSHDDLPEELKNVHVQRFISESEEPSWLGKLMGYRRERTGDEILERLSREKEKFNEKFRHLLREVGSENHGAYQKQGGVDWLQTLIDSAPIIAAGGLGAVPGLMNESPTATAIGGGAGAALGSLLAGRNVNERNKLRTMAGEMMPDNKSLFDYELPMSPALLAALGLGGAGLTYAMKQSAWARFSAQEKNAGVRFYRRFPINENMAMNLSFGGPSLTLRKIIPGMSLTLGNRAPRMYVSTPIPGVAYQQYISPKKHKIKAEKEFPDEPRSKDDEPDNRTTWQKVRDFFFGSEYGDGDES